MGGGESKEAFGMEGDENRVDIRNGGGMELGGKGVRLVELSSTTSGAPM